MIYIVSAALSQDKQEALINLQIKLSLVVFPLIFLTRGMNNQELKSISLSFVLGCLVAFFVSLINATYCYFEHGWWECFFTSYLVYNMHTSYIAMYTVFALFIAVRQVIINPNSLSKVERKLYYISFPLLFIFVILLASKSGYISLGIAITFIFIEYVRKKKRLKLALAGLAVFLVLACSLAFNGIVKGKFFQVTETLRISEAELFEKHASTTESSPVRRMIWIESVKIIKNNPMGVGVGDTKEVLKQSFLNRNMTGAIEKELNCHNQYLQTTVSSGYLGLIALIVYLIFPLSATFKRNFEPTLLFLSTLVIINLFFESMFEVQAGVVYIGFFIGLLVVNKVNSNC
ncbi:MAG: O-antigen ligase family protein [Flavobacteriales bacterium]